MERQRWQRRGGVASLFIVLVLLLCLVATEAASPARELNSVEDGLARFHLGHHHSHDRERTHANPDAAHVPWSSVLTADQHARALGYMGTKDALRRVIRKLQAGKPIVMSVIGGSLSALHVARDESWTSAKASGHEGSWSRILFDTLTKTWPNPEHKYVNSAVPDTGSAYFASCLGRHVPKNADIILLEFAIGDPYGTADTQAAVEQIVRRLYHWQSPMPAMVFVNYWDNWPGAPSQTWVSFQQLGAWNPSLRGGTEEILLRIAQYYDVPLVSFKNAMLAEDLQMTPGYSYEDFAESWNRPNALGHHMLADAVFGLFYTALSVENTEAQCPMGAFETQQMAPLDVLPPPLVKDNNASLPLVCFAGGKWGGDERVTAQGFVLTEDGEDAGYEATTAGATMAVRLRGGVKFAGVSYLRAPEGMGRALVVCSGSCACDSKLEGHIDKPSGPVVTHARVAVGSSEGSDDCSLNITVEPSHLSTGGVKFRVIAVAAGGEGIDGTKGWPAGHDTDVGAYLSTIRA